MRMRDRPCERCGWKFPGFHVCIDLSKPVDTKVLNKHIRAHNFFVTPELRQQRSANATERWRLHRAENLERDKRIVEAYKQGGSIKSVAKEYGIASQTCMGILHRAAERGEVTIRPKGFNVRFSEDNYRDHEEAEATQDAGQAPVIRS